MGNGMHDDTGSLRADTWMTQAFGADTQTSRYGQRSTALRTQQLQLAASRNARVQSDRWAVAVKNRVAEHRHLRVTSALCCVCATVFPLR